MNFDKKSLSKNDNALAAREVSSVFAAAGRSEEKNALVRMIAQTLNTFSAPDCAHFLHSIVSVSANFPFKQKIFRLI